LTSCTGIAIIYIFLLDNKCSSIWIDGSDIIGAVVCLKAEFSCGIIAVKTEVHGVTTM
jgi:hypothetical protein